MSWPGLAVTAVLAALAIWAVTRPERRQRCQADTDQCGGNVAAALRAEADDMMAVADATREPPAVTGQLSCGCLIRYLPYGEALVQPCRHHLYMRSPDFAAWAAEFGDRR